MHLLKMAPNHLILGHFCRISTHFWPKTLKNHTISEFDFVTLALASGP